MSRYEVPQAKHVPLKRINDIVNALLMKHCPAALQGNGHFDVLDYVEFHLTKEHETDYWVTDTLPPGTWAETSLTCLTLSEETYVDACNGDGFSRFTVAHELGHVHLHRDLMMTKRLFAQDQTSAELFTREQLEVFNDPEWQANEFAASLLMPVSGMTRLRQRCNERATFVAKVMETYKVSYSAANYRIDKLMRRGKLTF